MRGDDLYYYEENFTNKYGATFPIGLYCDIPDDNGYITNGLFVQQKKSEINS